MTVSIVLRAVKGVPLTNTEVDTNFTNLKVGIEEYTASDVLIKLKTVDGAGSGLDADLLDGLNATSSDLVGNSIVSRTAGNFSAGTITATLFIGPINGNVIGNVSGNVTGSAGTVAYTGLTGTPTIWNQNTTGTAAGLSGTLAVASGGTGATDPTDARINLSAATRGANSVVLGNGTSAVQTVAPGDSGNVLTSNGTSWISGTGTAAALVTTNSYQIKSLGVGTPASGVTGEIRATNNITAYYSDLRLKDVLGNIKNPLEAVLSLNGVIYKGNEVARGYGYTSDSEQVGLIAQEVQKVLPQVVVPAPFDIAQAEDGSEYSKSGENYLTIQYEKLIPLLIEAIKEQQVQISELKKCINQSN